MNKGITILGNLIVDYVKLIDYYPKMGMLSNILEISRCVGGCAANTSVDIAKIDRDVKVTSVGLVGNDENGEYIVDVLTENGVECSIKKTDQAPTSFTDVMSIKNTGERTFFHARGANALF